MRRVRDRETPEPAGQFANLIITSLAFQLFLRSAEFARELSIKGVNTFATL